MITKNVTIKITDDKATLSEKIILYKDDKGIDIYFTLSGFSYKFNKDNLSGVAVDARMLKPSGDVITINNLAVSGTNKIKFTIDNTMTDEIVEIGKHKLQISLYDDSTKTNRITIPPIEFEVKEQLSLLNIGGE